MYGFYFLFQNSRKEVIESPAAGDVDKGEGNSIEGYPFFCYLSEDCFCPKFKHATVHENQ